MITDKKAANAMGGKTARACDGCLRKSARWYCAADDAFLCQGCDTSVHSANQLAGRHDRFRLETASSKFSASVRNSTTNPDAPPAWYQGFTRKARTPRQKKSMLGQQKDDGKLLNPLDPLVPEIGSEEGSVDENDEQLLCRVPVFDPFAAELCNIVTSDGDEVSVVNEDGNLVVDGFELEGRCELDDGLHGFLPSDIDLAEFAADFESLLAAGLNKDTCKIKGIEFLHCKGEDESNAFDERKLKKVKDEEEQEGIAACCFDSAFDVTRESINWSFDYVSPTIAEVEEEKVVPTAEAMITKGENKVQMNRSMLLRLNYESVITAWASQGSPWTTESRPDFNPDDFMGSNPIKELHLNGGIGGIYSQGRGNNADGVREARLSRYREKRTMRLFSKKIRYEVRKLNAEKRPRMKGRFVKTTSFLGTAFPCIS